MRWWDRPSTVYIVILGIAPLCKFQNSELTSPNKDTFEVEWALSNLFSVAIGKGN